MNLQASLLVVALAAGIAAGDPALAKVSIVQGASAALGRGSTYAEARVWWRAFGSPAPAIVNEITAQQLQVAKPSGCLRIGRTTEWERFTQVLFADGAAFQIIRSAASTPRSRPAIQAAKFCADGPPPTLATSPSTWNGLRATL